MNRFERRHANHGKLNNGAHALNAPHDVRIERAKTAPVGAQFLAQLLSRQGPWIYDMTGWPEGAEVIGMGFDAQRLEAYLVLYKPDWPIVLAKANGQRELERLTINVNYRFAGGLGKDGIEQLRELLRNIEINAELLREAEGNEFGCNSIDDLARQALVLLPPAIDAPMTPPSP